MKERPILFSGPMVRALLDGSKTQTRRLAVTKRRGIDFIGGGPKGGPDWNDPTCWGFEDPNTGFWWALRGDETNYQLPCPHGAVGDRLWVRESFRFTSDFDGDSPARVGERCLDAGYKTAWAPIQYNADGAQRDWGWVGTPPGHAVTAGRTRASMHMPRWASRITLEVTGVRVERLRDISAADCLAEGIPSIDTPGAWSEPIPREPNLPAIYKGAFFALWESINGPESWDANPWVWVVEFKRVTA